MSRSLNLLHSRIYSEERALTSYKPTFKMFFKMLKVCTTLLLILAAAKCQGVDLTTQEGTRGSAVVSACIGRLRDSGIFSSDNEMLRRIAFVETDDGNDPNTYRNNYNGGIWAVDEDLFRETQNTTQNSSLVNLYQSIQNEFSIQWSSVQWTDLRKPLFSALASRLYLTAVSVTIPISSEVESQATYWATYYNPSGNTSTFVSRVNELLALNRKLGRRIVQGCIYTCCRLFFLPSLTSGSEPT